MRDADAPAAARRIVRCGRDGLTVPTGAAGLGTASRHAAEPRRVTRALRGSPPIVEHARRRGRAAPRRIEGRIAMTEATRTIDALDRDHPQATNGAAWELIEDRVMGGVSSATMSRETVAGRPALRMRGEVSLENGGGFVQVAIDLAPDGGAIDASDWSGIEIDVRGEDERYNLHLRTADVLRPWQSYRAEFAATPEWRSVRLPFDGFEPHRIEAPFDTTRLRRLGVVAIGRPFVADVAIGGLRFFR